MELRHFIALESHLSRFLGRWRRRVDPDSDGEYYDRPLEGCHGSVAADDADPSRPVFFVTEDQELGGRASVCRGRTRARQLPPRGATRCSPLVRDDGVCMQTADRADARAGRSTAQTRRSLCTTTGRVHFVAKKERKTVVIDLEALAYETRIGGKRFLEGGVIWEPARDGDPFGPERKYVCFRKDGGRTPVAYARHGDDGTFSTIFQGIDGVYDDDKTVGTAPSPDNKRLYFSIQDSGLIFETTRDDGLPFE